MECSMPCSGISGSHSCKQPSRLKVWGSKAVVVCLLWFPVPAFASTSAAGCFFAVNVSGGHCGDAAGFFKTDAGFFQGFPPVHPVVPADKFWRNSFNSTSKFFLWNSYSPPSCVLLRTQQRCAHQHGMLRSSNISHLLLWCWFSHRDISQLRWRFPCFFGRSSIRTSFGFGWSQIASGAGLVLSCEEEEPNFQMTALADKLPWLCPWHPRSSRARCSWQALTPHQLSQHWNFSRECFAPSLAQEPKALHVFPLPEMLASTNPLEAQTNDSRNIEPSATLPSTLFTTSFLEHSKVWMSFEDIPNNCLR